MTAEGIETDAALEHLREYGEIKGQGYLYGKPRPADETLSWLEENGLLGQSGTLADRRGYRTIFPGICLVTDQNTRAGTATAEHPGLDAAPGSA